MKYQLSGIIDAELTTLGKAHPELIQVLIDKGYNERASRSAEEPIFLIKRSGKFFKYSFIGPYIRPADTHVDRMRNELDDLTEKLTKLGIFLGTPKFLSLDKEMCDLLHRQFKVMKEYKEILEKRLELMKKQ